MTNDSTFQFDPNRPAQSSGKTDVQVVEEVTRLISRFQEDVFKRMDTSDHARFEQLSEFRSRMDSRFDVRDREFDDLADRFKSPAALLEERTAPFAELPARVERVELAVDHLEQQQGALTARLDNALDPKRPGATIEMVALQDRVTLLTRLVLATVGLSLFLLLLLALHIRQMAIWLPSVTGG
jgi:hypothetical protein